MEEEKIYYSNPVSGAEKLSDHPDMILDGQQRTTAIYYALKAPDRSLPNTDSSLLIFSGYQCTA